MLKLKTKDMFIINREQITEQCILKGQKGFWGTMQLCISINRERDMI